MSDIPLSDAERQLVLDAIFAQCRRVNGVAVPLLLEIARKIEGSDKRLFARDYRHRLDLAFASEANATAERPRRRLTVVSSD